MTNSKIYASVNSTNFGGFQRISWTNLPDSTNMAFWRTHSTVYAPETTGGISEVVGKAMVAPELEAKAVAGGAGGSAIAKSYSPLELTSGTGSDTSTVITAVDASRSYAATNTQDAAIQKSAERAFDSAIRDTYSSRPIQREKREEKKYSGKLLILK